MKTGIPTSPRISPDGALIAPDFLRLRAPATAGIAVALPKGARARRRRPARAHPAQWVTSRTRNNRHNRLTAKVFHKAANNLVRYAG